MTSLHKKVLQRTNRFFNPLHLVQSDILVGQ